MRQHDLVRLRKGDQVMGYKRSDGRSQWFSGNLSAWTGTPVSYDQTDRCTGFRDKNRRLLFENDIIRVKTGEDRTEELVIEIMYDELLDDFLLKEFGGDEFYDLDLLKRNQFTSNIEWYSYTFIQNI